MFFLKKIVAPFFMPLTVIVFLSVLGLLFLWLTKRQTFGKLLVTLGILLLTALSYGQFANRLIGPLEQAYAPYDTVMSKSSRSAKQLPVVKFVVVLGGGHTTAPNIPITSQASPSSLIRLIEGIRIYRKNPGSKLVVSGGAVFDPLPEAKTMADIAKSIGVPPADLILETASRDTRDQARNIKTIVGSEPFALVTSASHMPRAVSLFKMAGLTPIPAPTDYLVRKGQQVNPQSFFPSSQALHKSERAIYEYLGILWGKFNGRLSQLKQ